MQYYLLYFNQFSGQEIAIVQGAMNNCGDQDFPSIFVRLDDPEILDFIKSVVDGIKTKGKANGFGKFTFARDDKDNADYYIGEYKDGLKHGKGKFVWTTGDT